MPKHSEWNAAEYSLDARLGYGGGHTGWSRSWVACLMARLGRAEGVRVSFAWKDSKLISCTLLAKENTTLCVRSGDWNTTVSFEAGVLCDLLTDVQI